MENPPAFPVSTIDGFTQHGMDLRDWFAGQALVGLIAHPGNNGTPEGISSLSYAVADAMLAARAGK